MRIFKKTISFVLTLCLAMVCFFTIASGEVIGDTSITKGIDVVVVLDMTSSMVMGTNATNDPNGYRIDATAMLIGMMDMDGSRVAIVPFAGAPGNPVEIKEFTDISDSDSRTDLINEIYSKYPGKTKPDTNIGAALMKADQMLLNREDKTNRPMIVLMTDGKNDITNQGTNKIEVSHSLRWEDGQIVDKGLEYYTTTTADEVTTEAYQCAKDNNIPIYTVALGTDPDTKATDKGISLMDISRETGAIECQKVNKEEANNLPAFFAKVLANQIGSSVEYTAKPKLEEGTADTYAIQIPILNEKVLEANIILPVKARSGSLSGIDPNSLELLDSTGARRNGSTGINILHGNNNNSHFAMIKIREPNNPGMWTLKFKSDTSPDDISFNILYRYNLKFNVDIQNVSGGADFYKTDKLNMIARFVDENGTPVEDSALYLDHTDEEGYKDWMTIRSTWELFRASSAGISTGEVLKQGTLNANTVQNQFETVIDLAEGDKLPSGDYLLKITAKGAGFDREVGFPLELKNHSPIANDYSEKIEVNSTDENKRSTWTVEGTSGQLKASIFEIVSDPDHDDVRFELRPVDDAQSIAVMTMDESTGIISYKTIQANEKVKSGTAKYELFYNDQDRGTGSIVISLIVHSDVDAMLDAYDLEVKISGQNTGAGEDSYLKNTPIIITAKLKDKESGTYADGDLLAPLERQVQIADQKSGESIVRDGKMELNGDSLELTVDSTGNKDAEWAVKVRIEPYETFSKTIKIPNDNIPVPQESDAVTICCSGEKTPGFLSSVIGEDTPEDDPSRIVALNGLFTDADGDLLSYSEPRFINPATGETIEGDIIRAEAGFNGDPLTYSVHVSGEATAPFRYSMAGEMHITATDGDGETADFVRTVMIVDLYNKMITYILIILIAIIVLIIIYLIIHQIRKPVFPKLNMTIREEPSLYESSSEPLSPVKTSININALGVDSDMANKHGISVEQLLYIIVKPIRSRTSVGVICKKPIPGHEVMLDEVRMKQKKMYTWKVGQELTIRSENGDGLVAIKLEDRVDTDDTYKEISSDEWSEIDESTEVRGGRKHSRKAERRVPSAEEQQNTGSSDDFDF